MEQAGPGSDEEFRTLDVAAHCLARRLPEEATFTEPQTRMRCLVTVVWKGAGIRYNPAKIPEDAPWNMGDSFIHGAICGDGGTWATLPIIYTGVGRRLGYPIKLATGWGPKWHHLFCRWDDPKGNRFNVEANDTDVSLREKDPLGHRKADVLPLNDAWELDKHFGGDKYRKMYIEVRPPHVAQDAPKNIVD